MGNINVHLEDNYFNKFKELKLFLECRTNEETVEKIILLAQTHIQQINSPSQVPNQAKSSSEVKKSQATTSSNGAKKVSGNGSNNHG